MSDRVKLLVVLALALVLGISGWVISATAYHLYLDHIQVDQWRFELIQQQQRAVQQLQLQQQQQAQKPAPLPPQ